MEPHRIRPSARGTRYPFSEKITREKYETLRAAVKWDKDFPAGLIYHACAFDEKGTMRVADVWESKEQLDTFFATRLVPELQKMKIQPPQEAPASLFCFLFCALDQRLGLFLLA